MSIDRLPNGRDIGGHEGNEGRRVKPGRVFRSGMLIDPDLSPVLSELGIGRAFDLRTSEERAAQPDILPPGTELVISDMLADDPGSGPASLGRIARLAAERQHHDLSAAELRQTFTNGYRQFVTLESARTSSQEFLKALSDPSTPPVIVHCTAGKDRTGWLIALTLMVLGVDRDAVMSDYLASAKPVRELFAPFAEEYERRGGDLEVMKVATSVYPEYLEAALDQVSTSYASIEHFLEAGLGIGATELESIQSRLLES